jgi:hypothetical protein
MNHGDALKQAQGIMEDTIRCDKCERSKQGVNWDYVGDIYPITKKTLKEFKEKELQERANKPTILDGPEPFWQWVTPKAMADCYIKERQLDLKHMEARLKETLECFIKSQFLTMKEAPLYAVPEPRRGHQLDFALKAAAEDLLKGKTKEKSLPKTSDDVVASCFEALTKRHSMIDYYLKEIETLKNVIEYKDSDDGDYTLHCSNNHYADMTEYTKGTKAFYFWIDRHY